MQLPLFKPEPKMPAHYACSTASFRLRISFISRWPNSYSATSSSPTRIICGVSDCFGQHTVGSQHRPEEQKRKNQRPRKLGGCQRKVQHYWQHHRGEPENRVVRQEFAFSGFCHGAAVWLCSLWMRAKSPELSDAGGPARSHCQPTWPARVRSSGFVGPPFPEMSRIVRCGHAGNAATR